MVAEWEGDLTQISTKIEDIKFLQQNDTIISALNVWPSVCVSYLLCPSFHLSVAASLLFDHFAALLSAPSQKCSSHWCTSVLSLRQKRTARKEEWAEINTNVKRGKGSPNGLPICVCDTVSRGRIDIEMCDGGTSLKSLRTVHSKHHTCPPAPTF